MHKFDDPPSTRARGAASAAPEASVAPSPHEHMTLAEAAAYARARPADLLLAATHGRLRPVVIDPLDGAGTLLARPDIDAWRQRRLGHSS